MSLVVYGTSTCPHCERLRNFLDEKQVEYTYHLLVTEEEKDVLRNKGIRKVPAVFLDEEYVGGCDDYIRLYSEANK